MIETILPIAVTLFVLSQVSERISNFLKLYLPLKIVGNLDIKEKSPIKEKIRERKILLVSIVAGLITTGLVFGAYLIPAQDDSEQPPWVCYVYDHRCFAIPLMAFFLSFGSKFWHDLLDILFLYKNAQRVIRTGEGLQASSADEISAMVAMSSIQIARRVLADKRKGLMEIQGVVAVGIGHSEDEEPTLRVYFEDGTPAANISNELVWEDGSGILRTIRIEKIMSGRVKAQAVRVGGMIANEGEKSQLGTMGFVFQDSFDTKTYYASTCYHVVRPNGHSWDTYSKFPPDVVCHMLDETTCTEKSQLKKGGRSDVLDVALAKIETLNSLDIPNMPIVADSATINENYKGVSVKILTNRGKISGYIHDWETNVEVYYNDGSKRAFVDFFSIRLDKSSDPGGLKSPTVGGDSGSAVFKGKSALGMVVGASDKLTYAMKIKTIENNFGVKIYPHPSIKK